MSNIIYQKENETNVSKDEFERFVKVQKSGVINMVSSQVQDLADISEEAHLSIMSNYKELEKKYSNK
jgi:hypothetical protein